MLGLQLLRQLSRQDRFAGGNHERAQQRSNNDYRRTQMHDKTFGRWCRHPGSYWGTTAYKARSEEHTSELQSPMRISYAVFCLKKQKHKYKEYRPLVVKSNLINNNSTNST